MFLRIGFSNWNIIEKYFMMSFLSNPSAKKYLLSLQGQGLNSFSTIKLIYLFPLGLYLGN